MKWLMMNVMGERALNGVILNEVMSFVLCELELFTVFHGSNKKGVSICCG